MEKIPTDLSKVLKSNSHAYSKWKDLTPIARRDFISWIDGAKQEETRVRRINVTCDKLVSGKRRPCCYAIVPMNLYKALLEIPKAKSHWKSLTPDERRDFVDWIDDAKNPVQHAERINTACAMLSSFKRHP